MPVSLKSFTLSTACLTRNSGTEDIPTGSKDKRFRYKEKVQVSVRSYQHVDVGVVPSIVELLHGMFQPDEVLHPAAAAARVKLRLAVLANAKSGVGKISKVPPFHEVLQHTKVGAAAVQLHHPA
jgi:hypothetical protein